MTGEADKRVIRDTDAEALRLAKTLLRTARFTAIAVNEPETGFPLASRVGVATDADGAPLILMSLLSAHTRAIDADPRCSLLLGEPGKGDPLAHARMTLVCRAARLQTGTAEHDRAMRRYLNRNPKARLYAGLGDFSIFRLEPERASLNGGFGRAYMLARDDLLAQGHAVEALADAEQSALDHMNADHLDTVQSYARHLAEATGDGWTMTGIDTEGFDLARGDAIARIFFKQPLTEAAQLRQVLVNLARESSVAQNP